VPPSRLAEHEAGTYQEKRKKTCRSCFVAITKKQEAALEAQLVATKAVAELGALKTEIAMLGTESLASSVFTMPESKTSKANIKDVEKEATANSPIRVQEIEYSNAIASEDEQKQKDEEQKRRDEAMKAVKDAERACFTKTQREARQKRIDDLKAKIEKKEEEAEKLWTNQVEAETELVKAQGQQEEVLPALGAIDGDNTGAYLVYSPDHNGVMKMVWSRSKVEGAIAMARPQAKVPDFKYAKGGKAELVRNIGARKSSFYLAWAIYVKRCHKYQCRLVDLGREVVLPLSLILQYEADCKIVKVTPNEDFTLEGVARVAAIHQDAKALDEALEIGSIVSEKFVALANEVGEVVTL
jgi:hypothetical protein